MNVGQDVEKRKLYTFEGKLVQSLWKPVWSFLKLKTELLYDPAVALLGMYPKNPETLIQKDKCTLVL